jgi:hypothetical protein
VCATKLAKFCGRRKRISIHRAQTFSPSLSSISHAEIRAQTGRRKGRKTKTKNCISLSLKWDVRKKTEIRGEFFFFSHAGTYAKFIYNFVPKDGTGGSYFNLTLSYSNRAQRGETSLRYSLISSPPHTLLYSTLQWPARTKLGIKSGVRNNILS